VRNDSEINGYTFLQSHVWSDKMIRVAICDDHEVVRRGFKDILSAIGDIEISAEAANGREALDIARKGQCDVMLLDISMPEQNGIDTLLAIRRGQLKLPIIMLSGYAAPQYAVNVLEMGAAGYLDKDCEIEEITRAIRTVVKGLRYVSPAVGDMLAKRLGNSNAPSHTTLSSREFQVFYRLAKGELVSEIAKGLCLSVKTISTYRTRVLEKMELHSNSEITYYAMKHGLLE
jgi:DNA-binding NarL/FixJ family response regulator